jgi:hypothetical protein
MPDQPWPIKTRYVVDLWLHGYAMLQNDTTRVPYFKRGYRDRLVVTKNSQNVLTQLDVNADKLRERLATNANLVSGQFLALQERSWEEMYADINTFLKANGDPGAARDRQTQYVIRIFAQTFQNAADREWLRLFSLAVNDEHQKFYQSYWNQRQRSDAAILTAVDSLWTKRYYPRYRGFLQNTQQGKGEVFLSLPLDGEGRTVPGATAISFPDSLANAVDAVYVFTHEMVGTVAAQAVNDNTTPTEKRQGVADRYQSPAAVRGGALLIQRVAPELLTGYQRYYLRSANIVAQGDPSAAFTRAFPLPAAMLDAIARQLDVVLGGI